MPPSLDFTALLTTEGLISLITLSVLEIVLGIDNIIVISILSGELPTRAEQRKAQRLGLALAMFTRIALLFTLSWMAGLVEPLFHMGSLPVTGRGLVLILGGIFLLWKAGTELYSIIELREATEEERKKSVPGRLARIIVQIILIDIVFSLDSVITAVGMSRQLVIMALAVVIAVLIMLVASGPISDFVNRHWTVKVLALAFLVLVGVVLIVDGAGHHVDRAFMYAAMAFSMLVEGLHLRRRRNLRLREGQRDQ